MTTRRFHPTRDQIPAARRFVHRSVVELGGAPDGRLQDDVALLTSEAVANAVDHAGTDIQVTVERLGSTYLISVHDDAPSRIPGAGRLGHLSSTGGRGIAIIDAVAERWGVDVAVDDGKTLWFVPTPPERPADDRDRGR